MKSSYGNLEIPARLRCDLEITRSSFVGLELTHSSFAGPNLQIWTHRVAISGSPWQHYGNLEIPARLRCDLEITRSSFAGLELTHSSFAGPNLQIWTYRVAISRSPF